MTFLVVDIETVPDPELADLVSDPDKIPPPTHHQVACIGALAFDDAYQIRKVGIIGEGLSEALQLKAFAATLEKSPTVVTFNGRGFDLPVIAARSFRHGISLPGYYRQRDMRYRFTERGHFDVADYLTDFGASKMSKLDVWAKLCGMPGKVGVSGADVAGMVAAGRIHEVRDYCLCDVAQTAAVFLRVQLLRGVVSRDLYYASMVFLLKAIAETPALAPVRAALNEKRLLLEE